jgi:pyruvate formate lyase activating enzyme
MDRYATHDGPGVRTVLYFRGCPLRCEWCSNPEGQTSKPVLVFVKERCTNCGLCPEVCPLEALELQQTMVQVNRSKCNLCGVCLPVCPTGALDIWGKAYSVADLLEILERNRIIYRISGGGVTCSGGDPLYQGHFLMELLKACRRRGIHTAVETSAYTDRDLFKAMLQEVDWLFIDLKHMDSEAHRRLTCKNNDLILDNARVASSILQARGKALVVRMVVIPGVNDGQNIHDLADFLSSLPFLTMVELLTYHNYGVYKYDLIDRSYDLLETKPPTAEMMEECRTILKNRGLSVA